MCKLRAMKTLLLSILVFVSTLCSAQIDQEEIEQFWNTQIDAIVKLDKKAINKYSLHPPNGDWGYLVGLDEEVSWTHDNFLENLEYIFFEELRTYLKEGNSELVEIWDSEEGLFLIIKYNELIYEDEMEFETTTILQFSKIDGNWILTEYLIAG